MGGAYDQQPARPWQDVAAEYAYALLLGVENRGAAHDVDDRLHRECRFLTGLPCDCNKFGSLNLFIPGIIKRREILILPHDLPIVRIYGVQGMTRADDDITQ